MKQQSKLSSEQQPHTEAHQSLAAGQDFSSVDELLRFDAAQTIVPPKVTQRLQKSANRLAPAAPPAGWLKRIFG